MITSQQSILKDIQLTIQKGERVAIVGPSGAGKSTLLNILGGLDLTYLGDYYFNATHLKSLSVQALAQYRNQHMGFVFQSFFLLEQCTAWQNAMLPLLYRGYSHQQGKRRALQCLEQLDMLAVANHFPHQLSGGQQQRVAIARAMVGDPDLILADEPTGALDGATAQAVLDILINLNRQAGCTIVMITHDPQISRYCERIVTLQEGRIKT